jgi:hypothetical protein
MKVRPASKPPAAKPEATADRRLPSWEDRERLQRELEAVDRAMKANRKATRRRR